ncbi:regulation of nuclear pre-mRNA domain-containing protein 2-like isoform X3 [Eriocheir sinensis]|uniref:regulation of nuclear pre-mRNA domain-containing protein 2-like isoform X3 n=1 Tax=Eriocheir sinensis TaxID=95602 RepID=UPI0021C6C962|nr:regulation of nuclear pre-mRNA domain-containing protein 2-like isoform X3 [Eriocheir sinensis]
MSKTKESKMDSRSLEKRLSAVRETAEDIQALSRWCVQHKNHHHSIIQAWSRTVRKSKVPHRLTLFYVCNDIVQNSRRKKIPDLVQHFATAIKEAAPLVREEKIRPKIIRIFNIWEERGVYDAKFVSELTEIVENVGTVNASENEVVLSSFQPVQLVEGIRGVLALNKSTESMLTDLKNQEFSLGDEEINQLRQTVKERGTSRERMEEFEEALIALECYLAAVQKEVEERTQLVTLLEQAEIFYETQRGEAKLVANAYKNFGNRVKSLHSKLLEKAKTLPEGSPIPSPSVDAPSPENSDEEDLSLPDSGSSESRELYRSSSRDRSGAEWEYSHLVREREYSHTSSTTYDVPTPVPPPKELKPMSAAELLDTFGRAYQSSSKSVVGTAISSGATASEYKAPKTPTTPNSSIPDLSRPPPGLSGAITPGNPPVTDTPAYSPLPTTTQAHYSQTYPLPETSPKAPYVAAEPTYTPYDPSSTWAPPPPPPPPPPELQGGGTERVGPEYDVGRSYSPTWSEFESYSSAPGDVNDDEADNRNWGEPPGNEELQALASDTPSSPPIFEKGFTGALVPPPLPPPFCARSNLRELVSEGEDGDHRKNLVNIQPKGEDSDYRCYDYSFLSDQVSKSKTVKVPSIHSLFSSGDDLDLRVKKSGIKQSKDDSGSDMDISASGSEEDKDDMDISDESGKDALNKKGERKAEKKNHSKENKSQGNSSNCAKQDNGTKKKVSSNLPISVNKNAKPSSDNKVIEDKPGSTQSKSSDLKTDGSAADVKVSKIESVKPEKRKSVDHDNDNSAKIQKSLDKSGSNSNNDVDDKGDVSDEGRDWYKDFSKTGEDKQIAEEPIPTVVPKTGGRGHSNSRAMEETNVIDVIKSLDREFHQQRAKGNFNSHSNRGGSFFSDGGSPQHGNGGYFKGPKPLRGRPGGPGFYPPHRGRGRPQPLLPFGPPGRGFYGGHEPFARGRGGGRRGLRGRGRW